MARERVIGRVAKVGVKITAEPVGPDYVTLRVRATGRTRKSGWYLTLQTLRSSPVDPCLGFGSVLA